MAQIVENDKEKFPNARLTKTNFLSSVRDFKPQGVRCGVERVSKIFPVKQEPSKAQMMVEIVIDDDMEKCRLLKLDDEGEYVTRLDEITGNEIKEVVLEEVKRDDLLMFPIFLPCGKPKKIANDSPLTFYPTSSAYPLFKFALINAGELPADMGDKAFSTTQEELKEALEGLIFLAKCEEIKGKFNYMRLQVEEAEL